MSNIPEVDTSEIDQHRPMESISAMAPGWRIRHDQQDKYADSIAAVAIGLDAYGRAYLVSEYGANYALRDRRIKVRYSAPSGSFLAILVLGVFWWGWQGS